MTAGFGPALVAALPTYAGFGLIAGIVMGPTGMRPADVAAGAAASPVVRVVLWAAWIAALAPAARRWLLASEGIYLRWLPIARPLSWLVNALGLLALELPWALLWHLSSPPAAGIAAALAAAGAHAALAVRRRGREFWLGAAALAAVGAALVARPVPDAWVAGVGLAALVVATAAAFARAAEAPAPLWRPRPAGRPLVALWLHHAGRLIDASLAGRVVIAAAVAGGLAGVFAATNQLDPRSMIAATAAAAALGTVGVAARAGLALIDDARALDWVAASAGAGREARAAALVGASLSAGAVAGLAVGGVAALVAGAPVASSLSAIGAAVIAATVPAAAAVAAARVDVKGRDARVWAVACAAGAGLALAVAAIGPIALAVVPGAALAAFGVLSS